MRILAIAAHPDDEVLGCGATLAKHAKENDEVHILILAEGATSRATVRDREKWLHKISELKEASTEAGNILGASSVTLESFPDNRMDSCDLLDVIKVIEVSLDKYRPDIVYTHHAGDLNIDHCRVHEAVNVSCRPMPSSSVKTLLYFEVPSSTEWQPPGSAPAFSPSWFVDISQTLSLKLDALKVYQSEMREWPHPRSLEAVEHLARWRGATVGRTACESFVVGRNIQY